MEQVPVGLPGGQIDDHAILGGFSQRMLPVLGQVKTRGQSSILSQPTTPVDSKVVDSDEKVVIRTYFENDPITKIGIPCSTQAWIHRRHSNLGSRTVHEKSSQEYP